MVTLGNLFIGAEVIRILCYTGKFLPFSAFDTVGWATGRASSL